MRDKIFKIVFRIVGVILLLLGLHMMAEGVMNYIDEHRQQDWTMVTAHVIEVDDEYHSGGGRRHHIRHSHVDYDITYVYEVDGAEYTGMIYNQSEPMSRGDSVTVKYDPENPESSTYILKPYFGGLILFLAIGAVLIAAGFYMSGLWALIRRIVRRDGPAEEKELPPEEYVTAVQINKSRKAPAISVVGVVIIAAIMAGTVIFSMKQNFGIPSIDTRDFKTAMESEGYTVSVTTEKLKEEWNLGSTLEESVSCDDGRIRIDFCLMQTDNDAIRLYDGMTLPVYDGEKQELVGGGEYELCYAENETLYAMKIRVLDTVVYAAAKSEYKDELMEIMEKIEYVTED